jgi:hypothetical protein
MGGIGGLSASVSSRVYKERIGGQSASEVYDLVNRINHRVAQRNQRIEAVEHHGFHFVPR